MLKKVLAGLLSLTLAAGGFMLPETEMVYAAKLSVEQRLEQEYREMEQELREASDSELNEECDSPVPDMPRDGERKQDRIGEADKTDEMAGTAGTDRTIAGAELFTSGAEAAFSDGAADFFTDEDPDAPAEPDEPTSPGEPAEPDEPTDPDEPEEPVVPTDPEAPINPEEPYKPDIPEGVTEVTLEAAEGEDIAWKLNGILIALKERATDEAPCRVIIPPGSYTVTKTICTYSNIHIYAVGAVITKISPEKRMLLRLGNKEGSEGGYNGYRNVTIEGGTWDVNFDTIPNKEEEGGCTGFRLGHVTNLVVKDVTLKNSLKSHLLEIAGVKNARITGCHFSGYWTPYEGGAQECIQMDICHEKYFPNYSPSDRSVCEDIYIEGNTFEDSFAGVGCHSMSFGNPFRNIVIRNNTFRNIRKRAVWVTNSVDTVVENNSMLNVGGGIYARSMYSHCAYINEGQNASSKENQYPLNLTVKNNEISLNPPEVIGTALWKSFGVYLGGEKCVSAENNIPDGTYPVKKATVSGNKISGPGKGIQCVLAQECVISGNTMEAESAGEYENMGVILGGSSNNKITGNKISGCAGPGVYVYRGAADYSRPSRTNTISGNSVSGCAGDGIAVNRTCDSNKIEKNTVSKNAGNGISIWSNDKSLLKSNRTSENGLAGILVSGGSSAEIRENTADANGTDGIRTEGVNPKLMVSKNICKANKENGIRTGGADSAVLTENTAEKNGKLGIHVLDSKKVSLLKNSLKSNKEYGVFGTNASITVFKGNSLKKNGFSDTIYLVNASLPYLGY